MALMSKELADALESIKLLEERVALIEEALAPAEEGEDELHVIDSAS